MSDYDQMRHSRVFPSQLADPGDRSAGFLWVLIIIAALGLLVFISSSGGGPRVAEHPGGAGATPVAVPVEPAADPGSAGTVIE